MGQLQVEVPRVSVETEGLMQAIVVSP